MNLKKGDLIELTIDKIVYGGEGLGNYNGFAVFVPMSVPGDKIKAEIISLKKTYGRALIKEIIEPGKERVENTDKITFEDFHGCDFAMLKYDAQLRYKKEMVEDVVKRVGKITDAEIFDTIGSENPFHYRNKIIEPFSKIGNRIVTGFFKKKSHDVFEVEENTLNSKLGNKIIDELKVILNERKISVYNEHEHKGILRHIMVRTNSQNEAMAVLIVNLPKVSEEIKEILLLLKDKVKEIKSLYVSLNTRRTNVAIGDRNINIWGAKTIKENLFGIDFNISPTSFFQINLEQTKKLYGTALDYFEDISNKSVVDAYSGTGTIGMILSKKAKYVYAIELIESATEDGKRTAKENDVQNIAFINGDVNKELLKLIKEEKKMDSIIFDPPRKGIEESTLIKVAETGIKELIYISCNPSTFARDAEVLTKNGYKLEKVQPVDMFPQTSHIEVVGRFIRI